MDIPSLDYSNALYKCYIYLIQSDIDTCPSLELQERILVDIAEQNELNAIEVIVEKQNSHSKFRRLIKKLKNGTVEVILTYSFSQLPSFDESMFAQILTSEQFGYLNSSEQK